MAVAKLTVSAAAVAALFMAPGIEGYFKLDPLPYDYDALEPYIDKETMELHHGKHHATYVDKLVVAAEQSHFKAWLNEDEHGHPRSTPFKGDAFELTRLQAKASKIHSQVRQNGGGHYNHALFWVNMASPKTPSEPSPDLAAAIKDAFGSLDAMKDQFALASMARFGSGWVWLGVTPSGKLAITSTANQDNPLMQGLEYEYEKMIPILGLDVWEHAYYLTYRNRRADYIKAWWNVVNWKKVSYSYETYAVHGKPAPPCHNFTSGSGRTTEL
eukprot:TRINITY_DN40389_c0_g1_i1.p1 TRINITY_DN40389_c0_g1~~TRINITY_DN40389_c0_g1_i1.p1  ORF type:complete len:271 (+),score=52.35 TRINITY_DN40389_c0_g1_i1:74-886(+)